ncbi:Segregation and condensation protein B [hydrothermal vent metagenome]|uniref:Segregation and condensation protein B n=1 Tax=hydrothermal vent metagenome TaxID=652676 RepID=A0A3B1BFG1_9ZZZZ
MNEDELKKILEAVIYAADEPMSLNRLMSLFPEDNHPGREAINAAISQLQEETADRSIELKLVGSGYRYQVRQNYAEWVSKLWEERPARYSRASLETLALMAYRQPVTRAEIEEVRGVSVSSNIIKAFIERDWVKIVGHRDVPGKPALYATTKGFLDYFNLSSLEDLPSLAEIRDIDSINEKLELSMPGENTAMAVDEDRPVATDANVLDEISPEIETATATDVDKLAEPVNG